MHLRKGILLCQLALAIYTIPSQAILPKKDLATLTVEEAREAVRYVDSGAESGDLFRAAVKANRLDLLAVYVESGGVEYNVEKMPNSVLKDKIVVLMIKAQEGYFPWEKDFLPTRRVRGAIPTPKTPPYRSVLERLLPGRTLPKDVFYTKASRMALVAELEAAIEAGVGEPKPANPVIPPEKEKTTPLPKAAPTPPAPPIPTPSPPPAKESATPLRQISTSPVERHALVWPWVVGFISLTALAALAWKRRA